MPVLQTRFFGELEFQECDAFFFPSGVPGFESSRHFVFLNRDGYEPLTFLQSVELAALCFILLPIQVVDHTYRVELTSEQREDLGFDRTAPLHRGTDYFCAAVICCEEDGPTANLLAPIIVNLKTNKGMQIVRIDSGYSLRTPLAMEALTKC
jgi:flagellar assembly factor FliW